MMPGINEAEYRHGKPEGATCINNWLGLGNALCLGVSGPGTLTDKHIFHFFKVCHDNELASTHSNGRKNLTLVGYAICTLVSGLIASVVEAIVKIAISIFTLPGIFFGSCTGGISPVIPVAFFTSGIASFGGLINAFPVAYGVLTKPRYFDKSPLTTPQRNEREMHVSGVDSSAASVGTEWRALFAQYKDLLSETSIVREQYAAYKSSSAPTIADLRIKEIPIYENGEELVNLKEISVDRIEMLPDPSSPFEGPSVNSGLPSASKMRVGVFIKLQRMLEVLDELSIRFGYTPGQISIKVFEGLRDLNTQKALFEKKLKEIQALHPEFTLEMAEQETAKWVSPYRNNVPVHSTGAAVDIRLWDNKKGDFVDMGSFGVIWGVNKNVATFSEDISDKQKQNRLYCLLAAEKAGLTNYVYEFWHFSSKDRYAVYWNEPDQHQRRALYGSV